MLLRLWDKTTSYLCAIPHSCFGATNRTCINTLRTLRMNDFLLYRTFFPTMLQDELGVSLWNHCHVYLAGRLLGHSYPGWSLWKMNWHRGIFIWGATQPTPENRLSIVKSTASVKTSRWSGAWWVYWKKGRKAPHNLILNQISWRTQKIDASKVSSTLSILFRDFAANKSRDLEQFY